MTDAQTETSTDPVRNMHETMLHNTIRLSMRTGNDAPTLWANAAGTISAWAAHRLLARLTQLDPKAAREFTAELIEELEDGEYCGSMVDTAIDMGFDPQPWMDREFANQDATPRIVAICGSTRFMDAMVDADRAETAAGRIVVKPGCNMKQPHELWDTEEKAELLKVRLDELHRAKIRMASEVLVVGDYIGSSTTAEILYARELGKPIRFTHANVELGVAAIAEES
jgi:hypothetical protein